MEETKICKDCKKELPISEYYLNKQKRGTYPYPRCKSCHKKKMTPIFNEWRKENREQWNKSMNSAVKAFKERSTAGIYLLHTDKGRYIGSSKHIQFRVHQHKDSTQKCIVSQMNCKILSYEILEEENDKERRLDLERYYVNELLPELNTIYHPDWYKTSTGQWEKNLKIKLCITFTKYLE